MEMLYNKNRQVYKMAPRQNARPTLCPVL